jgi:DNA-binding beta-propeller fold protein YncE
VSGDRRPDSLLFVANQMEHSVLLVDPMSKQVLATVGVDINGHEVAVSPDGRFGYVPIYGNTWVGKPGSNGSKLRCSSPIVAAYDHVLCTLVASQLTL